MKYPESASRALLLGLAVSAFAAQPGVAQTRTVSGSEIGNVMMIPNGYTWDQVGAYDTYPTSGNFQFLPADAIKAKHGRFQHFMPADQLAYAYFPYNELKALDASQVAAGYDPIFVTATYQGKKRPVYVYWSLGLNSSNMATADKSMWMQAVNVSDPRFVSFFINKYVYPRLWPKKTAEDWIGLDNGSFIYALYGVLDDNNHFVSNVTWDKPFAQNQAAFESGIESFFSQVKAEDPAIGASMMINVGTIPDWSTFPKLYANVAGLLTESITTDMVDNYSRSKMLNEFNSYFWFSNTVNRPAIFRSEYIVQGDPSSLMTGVVSYMLLRGPNTFFAPKYVNTSTAVPPADYQSMFTAIGKATGPLVYKSTSTTAPGKVLYSRTTANGIVYLNWTGAPITVTLPTTSVYKDPSGKVVKQLQIADQVGVYVTNR